MRDLFASFSFPWQIWVMFGLIIGGLLYSKGIRNETERFIAHAIGFKPKKKRRER